MHLIKDYNESVKTADASNTTPDIATFLRRRDQIVQLTRDELATALKPDGMTRFHAHIQQEKRGMKVAAKEGK